MDDYWILALKILGGVSIAAIVAALCTAIRHIWIARIQRHDAKLVELRQEVDGASQLTIKGYSQEDGAKIAKQLTQNGRFTIQSRAEGGNSSLSNTLKP